MLHLRAASWRAPTCQPRPAMEPHLTPAPSLPPRSRAIRTALIVLLVAGVATSVAALRGAFGTGSEHRARSIVDTMQGGGEALHAGFRRAHARGLCVSGRFIATGDAAALSSAPLVAAGAAPIPGRRSTGGGPPGAPGAGAGPGAAGPAAPAALAHTG